VTPVELAAGLSERDVLALTLHHEAGGERLEGMAAVGCVIRNRAAWGAWGPTMRDVCLARKQFSCWMRSGGVKNFERLQMHVKAIRELGITPPLMRRAYEMADALLGDTLGDVTAGADHYYAPLAMDEPGDVPHWAKGRAPVAIIGKHRFYRLRRGNDHEDDGA
jgi:hypothetical protein